MVPPPVMGGSGHRSRLKPDPRPQDPSGKKRVLFVCIGNSCRSQMAEAFARAYGSDILEVQSAGLSPATIIAPMTRQVLSEHNLRIDGHFPKSLEMFAQQPFDVIVNMSGYPVPVRGNVLTWPVTDPIGRSETVYRDVARQIEGLVMRLILELRAGNTPGPAGGPPRR